MPIRGGVGGGTPTQRLAPQSEAVKMCAREVECNGTSCARVEVKRKRYHKRPFPTSRRNLRHMQGGCTCCKSSPKWYYSTKKWCYNTKKVKNLYSRKKLAFFTLTLHPLHPLKGGMFLSFSLLFPFRFSGNQPDKSLISVIDNVCYVYPRARALCEEKGL